MVIKNLENKIKLVMIVSCLFMVGCIIISLGAIFTAKGMVDDAHKKVYVLDGNVPILVQRTTMDETLVRQAADDLHLLWPSAHRATYKHPDEKARNSWRTETCAEN